MKKTIKLLFLLIVGIFAMSGMAFAQSMELPVDTAVRVGKLSNGLTYYIRHNEYPKGQADFYIAQKVGSILEEDNQRGLAHFLEHMCFNGTKNFPGNEVVSWCESVGIKFGANLNAYTSVDQTVYNISNVPVARESVQDSCLLILHDWANDLLLDPEEIEKERGVIHEEWRRSNVGQMRILETLLPTIYPNSRYGYRLPIGLMEVVDNFPPQALRDYYETWYRPDQQAILVVGDIDVDRIEAKIKELFSDIEMPANPKERVYYPVDDNKETIYAIGKDTEMSQAIIEVFFKHDVIPDNMKNTMAYYVINYINHMVSSMLDSRFSEMRSKPDAPFAFAEADYGNFNLSKTKDAFTIVGIAKGNDIKPVLESIYREILRAYRGGFTATEYARARSEYLSELEKLYNNRNSQESGRLIKEYVNSFVDNEPIPGIEYEYSLMNLVAKQISVEEINAYFKELITDENRVILAFLPDNDEFIIPTEDDLSAVIAGVDAETIDAYVDNVKTEPLIAELPTPGSIVGESHNDMWDATEWLLSNGAKVIVKPTKFKDDEILFSAIAKGGGTSTFSDEYADDIIFMPLALSSYGLGDFSNDDLDKYLAGKHASVSFDFYPYAREVNGNSTVKDLATLMELLYMAFTNLNFTADEFAALQNTFKGVVDESNPSYVFVKRLRETLYKSPKEQVYSIDVIQKANREDIINMVHQMTANAADYTFCFTGNIDIDSLKPLVAQYIASLPGDATTAIREADLDPNIGIKEGTQIDESSFKMATPQSWAGIYDFGAMDYTAKNQKVASMAGQILSKRLIDIVREREGAVYSISANGSLSRISNWPLMIQTSFPMKPEMKEKVLDIISGEVKGMESNVTDEELNTVKEYMVKSFNESLEKNQSWLDAMTGFELNGVDTFNPSLEIIDSITVDDIQNLMKDLNEQGNYRVFILDPEEE